MTFLRRWFLPLGLYLITSFWGLVNLNAFSASSDNALLGVLLFRSLTAFVLILGGIALFSSKQRGFLFLIFLIANLNTPTHFFWLYSDSPSVSEPLQIVQNPQEWVKNQFPWENFALESLRHPIVTKRFQVQKLNLIRCAPDGTNGCRKQELLLSRPLGETPKLDWIDWVGTDCRDDSGACLDNLYSLQMGAFIQFSKFWLLRTAHDPHLSLLDPPYAEMNYPPASAFFSFQADGKIDWQSGVWFHLAALISYLFSFLPLLWYFYLKSSQPRWAFCSALGILLLWFFGLRFELDFGAQLSIAGLTIY